MPVLLGRKRLQSFTAKAAFVFSAERERDSPLSTRFVGSFGTTILGGPSGEILIRGERSLREYIQREGYSEVVQRSQGIRIHPALHWRGRIRPFFRDPRERLPHLE